MGDADLIPFTIPGYHVKYLQPEDSSVLQVLLERSSDYSQLVTGLPPEPSSANTLLVDRPEGKTLDDKFVIGIFNDPRELVGVLDSIRDYPGRHDWWLGLLLLDPKYRNKGLGKQVYCAFEGWVSQRGAQNIFLGVVEQNRRAYQFWQGMGFETVERRRPSRFGNSENVVIVMRRSLPGKMVVS
jgi:ribosomal protein S18 acetylase RimI-like enzyme